MLTNMKLRYIIPSFIAALTMLVGCSDDDTPTYLASVRVSQSFVTLPESGGTCDIEVTAKDSWTITDVAGWLTVAPAQGEAGTYTVTFSADKAYGLMTDTIFINCGGQRQDIYVFQEAKNVVKPHGETPADPFTVAEAIAKCEQLGATTDGVTYYGKGKISSISEVSTSYGNATFKISDDGTDAKALTCYRSFYLENTKFTSENQIKVGDEVIMTGKLVNYGGSTPEFSGSVYIYSLNGKTK